MPATHLWPRILVIAGSVAMLIGALDPLEGSIAILVGSGLLALGTFLGHGERHCIIYRACIFILVGFGVAALWALSNWGGIGGKSGHSGWWTLLIAPYPIGWSLAIWGPGSPRWVLALGFVIGAFHLFIASMILHGSPGRMTPGLSLGAFGLLTIVGCFYRSSIRAPARP